MQSHGIAKFAALARWQKGLGVLLSGVLVAGALAFVPTPARAATDGWWPHFWGKSEAFPGFWFTGEVMEVAEDSVTLVLPNKHHARGMMRYVSLNVTLDVGEESLLLTDDLAALELATLAEGDDVVVVPRLVWGNLVAQLLYAGEPEDLADAVYRGRLVADDGDTLTLENGRTGEFTVVVDEATVWYEDGQMVRPTELAEDIALRVLGVEEEDADGEEVIRAVLITPAK